MTASEIGLVDDAQVASDVLLPGLVRRSGPGLRSLNRSGRRPCARPGPGTGPGPAGDLSA